MNPITLILLETPEDGQMELVTGIGTDTTVVHVDWVELKTDASTNEDDIDYMLESIAQYLSDLSPWLGDADRDIDRCIRELLQRRLVLQNYRDQLLIDANKQTKAKDIRHPQGIDRR